MLPDRADQNARLSRSSQMESAAARPSRKVWTLRLRDIARLRESSVALREAMRFCLIRVVVRLWATVFSFRKWPLGPLCSRSGILFLMQIPNHKHDPDYDCCNSECSNNRDFRLFVHSSSSQGTSAPQLAGQRKPFKLPSNPLVVISFRSTQNLCPHFGQVSL